MRRRFRWRSLRASSGVGRRAANLLAIAYLLTPAAQGLSYDNFSENVFVPLLAFWRRARRATALVLAGADRRAAADGAERRPDSLRALVRGGVRAVVGPAHRARARVLAVANGVGFWTLRARDGRAAERPGVLAGDLRSVPASCRCSLLLLAPFAFAPLAVGRWLLLAAPLLAEIVFMRPWNYEPSRIGSHYVAPLLAATAARGGIRRARAIRASRAR